MSGGRLAAATLRFSTRRQPKTEKKAYRLNLEIPWGLDWICGTERGRVWWEALPALVGECAELWSLHLGRPHDDSYVSLVLPATRADGSGAVLKSLSISQGEQGLIHQDLHGDNVLRAEREPWLAIDPKPLAGERQFGLAPIIRSYEFGHGRDQVIGRLDRLCRELILGRERARGWALGQTLAWALAGNKALPRHVETACWLREAVR